MKSDFSVFHVICRQEMEEFTMENMVALVKHKHDKASASPRPYVVISINDPCQKPVTFQIDPWRKDIHHIGVIDVSTDLDLADYRQSWLNRHPGEEFDPKRGHLFDATDASNLLDFHNAYRNSLRAFVVHCQAGVSRSRAVATGLSLIEGNRDMAQFHIEHGVVNPLVLWEILHEHERRTGEKISWPQDMQIGFLPDCEHGEDNLRYRGSISIGEEPKEPPVCECCGKIGFKCTYDRLARWRDKYKNSEQGLAR